MLSHLCRGWAPGGMWPHCCADRPLCHVGCVHSGIRRSWPPPPECLPALSPRCISRCVLGQQSLGRSLSDEAEDISWLPSGLKVTLTLSQSQQTGQREGLGAPGHQNHKEGLLRLLGRSNKAERIGLTCF